MFSLCSCPKALAWPATVYAAMHESKVHNVVVLQDSATESMVANLAGRLADNSMAFLV